MRGATTGPVRDPERQAISKRTSRPCGGREPWTCRSRLLRVDAARQLRVGGRLCAPLGIVYVEFPTLERIPKSSFNWYRSYIARATGRTAAERSTAPPERRRGAGARTADSVLRRTGLRPSPEPSAPSAGDGEAHSGRPHREGTTRRTARHSVKRDEPDPHGGMAALGVDCRLVEPAAARHASASSTSGFARLDVLPTLDGVEPGLLDLLWLERGELRVLTTSVRCLATHDKLRTAVALGRAGIPHPRTTLLRAGSGSPLPRPPIG